MSILTVNLKHLYQRRGLWLVYVVLAVAIFGVFVTPLVRSPEAAKGQYVGPVVVAFLVGLLATFLQIEVLSKPFSYCLPGHHRVFRKYVFLVAVPVSILCSMLFLAYPGLNSWQLLLVLCSAFFAQLTFCLAGVALALNARNAAVVIGLLPLAVVVAEKFFDLHVLLERIIIEDGYLAIFAGILSAIAMSLWLSRPRLARRYCAAPWVSFLDLFNSNKMRRFARATAKWDRLKDHPRPWVERLFLGRMSRCDYSGSGRQIWGNLYTSLAMMLSRWWNIIWFVAIVVLIAGYVGPRVYFMFFIAPLIILPYMRSMVYSSMMIFGGRRQRFWAMLVNVLVTALVVACLVAITARLSVPLVGIMPSLTARGVTLRFQAINILLFYAPLLILPIACTFQLVFYKRPVGMIVTTLFLFYLLAALAIIWHKELMYLLTPALALAVLVLAWSVFALVLGHISAKRCLIRL